MKIKVRTTLIAGILLLCLSSCKAIPQANNTYPPADLIQYQDPIRHYPSDPSFGATVNYTIKLQDDDKQCIQKDNALIDFVRQYFKIDLRP